MRVSKFSGVVVAAAAVVVVVFYIKLHKWVGLCTLCGGGGGSIPW